MAADFFLIDAPFVVPAEFAAWQAAQDNHRIIFQQALLAVGTDQAEAMDAAGQAAQQEAARLEYAARQAWYRAGK